MNRLINGIVVREQPHGDKGKLLSVLTAEEGVLNIVATGARNIKASYLKSVQLFAYSELTVYEKNGFLTLVEANLIESFFDLRKDIEALSLAGYMAELASYTAVADSDDGILRLLLNCLYALTNGFPQTVVKAVFEYRLCVCAGLEPDFSVCAGCGSDDCVIFDFEDSLSYCDKCAPHDHRSFILDKGSLSALRYLNTCAPGKILSFGISGASLDRFSDFCEAYCISATEFRPKSLDYYISIKNSLKGACPLPKTLEEEEPSAE